jgi:tRNA splicing ligase
VRPGPLYVCYSRGSLHLTHTTDYDATDEFSFCVPASTVELGAKLAYYAAKAFEILRGLPAPPPPP